MVQEYSRHLSAPIPTFGEDYWLKRAKLIRSKAAAANDAKLQQRLQLVAFEYERLAACAAQKSTLAS